MPSRLDEFNKKFLYTKTSPENIVSAKKNALFFRRGKEFFVNPNGSDSTTWTKLPYRTVIIPPPVLTKIIKYQYPHEVWMKTTDGFYNEFNELMPKTGWKLVGYKNIFLPPSGGKTLKWLLPPPTNTDDPIGSDGQRSYDENYFYAKIGGKWYRTPIAIFSELGTPSAENPYLYANLPFVDEPRYTPSPTAPDDIGGIGEQSYDADFFYIMPSTKWKRSTLLVYVNPHKLAVF